MPLTDRACKCALPKEKAYKLTDGHGLYLQVMPNGSKYWRFKYRYFGKENRSAFGVYPEVTLADARDKCRKARKLLADNIDPAQARKHSKELALIKASNTFELLAREWHEKQSARWTPQYSANVLNRLKTDIFPAIGKEPISSITPLQLLRALQKVEDRGAHEVARRLLQVSGQIFRYAIITARTERNPAADLQGALRPFKHGHYAALDSRELPEFLITLEQNDARLHKRAAKF